MSLCGVLRRASARGGAALIPLALALRPRPCRTHIKASRATGHRLALLHSSARFFSSTPVASAGGISIVGPSPATVVLVGWLGCTAKNLEKYAHMHEASGYRVISHQPSAITPFIPSLGREPSLRLLRRLLDQVDRHPDDAIVFHLMSNNGAYHFAWLMHMLHNEPIFAPAERSRLLAHVRGIIFDSSPSPLTPSIFTRGYMGFISGYLLHKPIYSHPLLTPIVQACFRALLCLPYFQHKQEILSRSIHTRVPATAHLLYIYSAEDALIPHTDVEAHAREQARRSADVFLDQQRSSADSPLSPPVPSLTMQLAHSPLLNPDTAFDDLLELYAMSGGASVDSPVAPPDVASSIPRIVASFRFSGSGHVQHARKYPAAYQQLTHAFVQQLCADPRRSPR